MASHSRSSYKRRKHFRRTNTSQRLISNEKNKIDSLPVGIQKFKQILQALPRELIFEIYYITLKENITGFSKNWNFTEDPIEARVFEMLLNEHPLQITSHCCNISVRKDLSLDFVNKSWSLKNTVSPTTIITVSHEKIYKFLKSSNSKPTCLILRLDTPPFWMQMTNLFGDFHLTSPDSLKSLPRKCVAKVTEMVFPPSDASTKELCLSRWQNSLDHNLKKCTFHLDGSTIDCLDSIIKCETLKQLILSVQTGFINSATQDQLNYLLAVCQSPGFKTKITITLSDSFVLDGAMESTIRDECILHFVNILGSYVTDLDIQYVGLRGTLYKLFLSLGNIRNITLSTQFDRDYNDNDDDGHSDTALYEIDAPSATCIELQYSSFMSGMLPVYLNKMEKLKRVVIKNCRQLDERLISTMADTVEDLFLESVNISNKDVELPSQLKYLTISRPSDTLWFPNFSELIYLRTLRMYEYSSIKLVAEHLSYVPPNLTALSIEARNGKPMYDFDEIKLTRLTKITELTLTLKHENPEAPIKFSLLPPSLTCLNWNFFEDSYRNDVSSIQFQFMNGADTSCFGASMKGRCLSLEESDLSKVKSIQLMVASSSVTVKLKEIPSNLELFNVSFKEDKLSKVKVEIKKMTENTVSNLIRFLISSEHASTFFKRPSSGVFQDVNEAKVFAMVLKDYNIRINSYGCPVRGRKDVGQNQNDDDARYYEKKCTDLYSEIHLKSTADWLLLPKVSIPKITYLSFYLDECTIKAELQKWKSAPTHNLKICEFRLEASSIQYLKVFTSCETLQLLSLPISSEFVKLATKPQLNSLLKTFQTSMFKTKISLSLYDNSKGRYFHEPFPTSAQITRLVKLFYSYISDISIGDLKLKTLPYSLFPLMPNEDAFEAAFKVNDDGDDVDIGACLRAKHKQEVDEFLKNDFFDVDPEASIHEIEAPSATRIVLSYPAKEDTESKDSEFLLIYLSKMTRQT
ncbi:unnamed protein product [Ambrosiozyma monospora]|uniref:Unnamed protein product n=1 Tax=Ambrosiozyma monospora TaxID=43982 RepID=A0ACB5SRG4_AMBMO|nr:unnamed protein product [Ambrosiozyma monospora]